RAAGDMQESRAARQVHVVRQQGPDVLLRDLRLSGKSRVRRGVLPGPPDVSVVSLVSSRPEREISQGDRKIGSCEIYLFSRSRLTAPDLPISLSILFAAFRDEN